MHAICLATWSCSAREHPKGTDKSVVTQNLALRHSEPSGLNLAFILVSSGDVLGTGVYLTGSGYLFSCPAPVRRSLLPGVIGPDVGNRWMIDEDPHETS